MDLLIFSIIILRFANEYFIEILILLILFIQQLFPLFFGVLV